MLRVATWSGKVRKIFKNDKSQDKSGKMGSFEKKSGILIKKKLDFVSLNLQNSLFSKAFNW